MSKMTAEQVASALDARKRWQIEFGSSVGADAYRTAETLVRANLVETDEQRRERFERWCASNLRRPINPIRLQDGRYMDCVVQQWFEVWQAGATWRGEAEGGAK